MRIYISADGVIFRLKLRGKSAPKKKKGPPGMLERSSGRDWLLTMLQLLLARSDKPDDNNENISDIEHGGIVEPFRGSEILIYMPIVRLPICGDEIETARISVPLFMWPPSQYVQLFVSLPKIDCFDSQF
jgi:hypothetical protein